MTDRNPKIFVAGHRGMVGSAILRHLESLGYTDIVTKTREEVDLRCQASVDGFFRRSGIDQVYLAAAKVGGIYANNTYPAEFIYENLIIETNVINASHCNNIQKLLFLGSSCIYPRNANQPIREEYLLTGKLEPTNEAYALAKIAGIKLCESYNRQYGRDYRSVMPTNLYGPKDNYDALRSHVIPALISKFHSAKAADEPSVSVWGSGKAKREFLHVDDLASAAIHIMELDQDVFENSVDPMCSHINIGYGKDCSIKELAEIIKKTVGFKGEIVFDVEKPDGAPRKLLDTSKLQSLDWNPKIDLEAGLKKTYIDYLRRQV